MKSTNYSLKGTGLTFISTPEAYMDNPKSNYEKPTKDKLDATGKKNPYLDKNNPNISVENIVRVALGNISTAGQFTAATTKFKCESRLGSLDIIFKNKGFADYVSNNITLLNANETTLKDVGGVAIVAERHTYNGQELITIPAAAAENFITKILNFDQGFYNKVFRDVRMVQVAEQEGNLDLVKTDKPGLFGTRKKLDYDEVRQDTKEWVEKSKVCSIRPGDAIPVSVLLDVLNEKLGRKDEKFAEHIEKWIKKELNEEQNTKLPIAALNAKGGYNPLTQGWLAENHAAIFLHNVLEKNGVSEKDILSTVNELILESKVRLLQITNEKINTLSGASLDEASLSVLQTLVQRKKNIEDSFREKTATEKAAEQLVALYEKQDAKTKKFDFEKISPRENVTLLSESLNIPSSSGISSSSPSRARSTGRNADSYATSKITPSSSSKDYVAKSKESAELKK